MTTPTPSTAPKPEAPEWLPCPLCGDALDVSGDHIAHFFSDTCPLDQLYMEPRHRAAWNRRADLNASPAQEPVIRRTADLCEADYDRAIGILTRTKRASTSHLQREIGLGYNAAAKLMERAELEGFVSKPDHVGKRHVYAHPTPAPVADAEGVVEQINSLIKAADAAGLDDRKEGLRDALDVIAALRQHPAPQSDEAATLRAQLAEARNYLDALKAENARQDQLCDHLQAERDEALNALQSEKDHADRLYIVMKANLDALKAFGITGGAIQCAEYALAAHQARRAGSGDLVGGDLIIHNGKREQQTRCPSCGAAQ